MTRHNPVPSPRSTHARKRSLTSTRPPRWVHITPPPAPAHSAAMTDTMDALTPLTPEQVLEHWLAREVQPAPKLNHDRVRELLAVIDHRRGQAQLNATRLATRRAALLQANPHARKAA